MTTSFLQAPTRLYSAISKIVSIDSFFASPMKPQVLTTMTSASSGSSTMRQPRAVRDAEHHLGVDAVLDAAEADEVDFLLRVIEWLHSHGLHEALEEVERVVRARGGLGVVLHAEARRASRRRGPRRCRR